MAPIDKIPKFNFQNTFFIVISKIIYPQKFPLYGNMLQIVNVEKLNRMIQSQNNKL